MTRHSFIFILCVVFGLLQVSAADPGRLRGNVRDATTGEPIAGAIVKAGGAFASTDRAGDFDLALKQVADSVTVRCMGYETVTLPVATDRMEVSLTPRSTTLRDVIVEAPDIYARGDTLVFNVARYANSTDNAIIDVIKRLPGIKVKENGTIEYQGKPISKFYLDGNDFIGGQYGLATNNISYKDVKSVEVLENHQPVKALEGIEFPEEAGINLKLKEDARSRWVGVARGSVGVEPVLFDGSLFAMRMTSKMQNLMTVKADNTGWNPAGEIRDHSSDMSFSGDYSAGAWREYISADEVNAPLSEKRTRDNLSWLADAITAWKRGDTSMRLKVDYLGDRLDYNSGVVTDYIGTQLPPYVQHNALHTQNHELRAQLLAETNKRSHYMKEIFSLSGDITNSNSAITGSTDLAQRVRRKSLVAENNLNLIKRSEQRLFTLTSRNSFAHRPDRLLVAGDEGAAQRLSTTDFRSTTETRLGRMTRFWKYYLTAGLDMDYHRLQSSLSGLGELDNSGTNRIFQANLHVSPQIDYERGLWRLSARMPLTWANYFTGSYQGYFNLSPRLSVWRQMSAKSELSGAVGYSLVPPPAYLFVGRAIMEDYRNIFLASEADKYSRNVTASLSYRYRNPLKALFFNLSGGYAFRRSGRMSSQLFVDDLIITTYADQVANSSTWHLKGGFSKGLGHSKMVVGADCNASLTSASSMRDGAVIPYRQTTASMKPYFKGNIIRQLSANYEAEYALSRLSIGANKSISHSMRQAAMLVFIPDSRVDLTIGAEHYFTRLPEGSHASLILLDASAVWRASSKIRLSLTANNLLNKRRYEYTTYGTLSRSEHTFHLRTRTLLATLQYRL